MRLQERFQLAFESQLGVVLIGLVIGLVIMAFIYWVLVARQKRRDLLAYLYRSYFDRVQGLTQEFQFLGGHKAEFFGRQSVVKLAQGGYGLCTVPPPTWMEGEVRDRLRRYFQATAPLKISGIAPVVWSHDETAIALVEGGGVDASGRLLPTLRHHMFNPKLLSSSREQILMELARALASLHEQQTELREPLYHGFLLPRTIRLGIDAHSNVNRVLIEQSGLAFALGPKLLSDYIAALRTGKLPIERYAAQELLEQLVLLAPEQRDSRRAQEVGPASDFYAFGTIAVSLLSNQRFITADKVEWQRIPERWVPFLRLCLSDAPSQRPHDFAELEDLLQDPELVLTYSNELSTERSSRTAQCSEAVILTKNRPRQGLESVGGGNGFEGSYQEGMKALRTGKWQLAKKGLSQAVEINPQHAVAQVSLAIACYELQEKRKAEIHYELAKQLDPQAAKLFRQHLAFNL